MFIAREPVLENMFCRHDSTQSTPINPGVSPVVSPQGALCTIAGCDGETTIVKKMTACSQKPFGWLMQEIRTDYNHEYIPFNGMMAKDMGTQKTFVGYPIGVAHLGIYDTNVYNVESGGVTAGADLYPTASGTLSTSSGTGYCATSVAVALNSLSNAEMSAGRYLRIKCLL